MSVHRLDFWRRIWLRGTAARVKVDWQRFFFIGGLAEIGNGRLDDAAEVGEGLKTWAWEVGPWSRGPGVDCRYIFSHGC
jgi:hypothetical protein